MECMNSVVGSVIKVFDWVFNPSWFFCHGITQILILPKYSKDLLSGVKLRIFFPKPVNGLIGSLLHLVWPQVFLFGFSIYQLEHLLDFTLRLRQLLLVVQQRIGLPGAALVGLARLKALLHDGHKCMWPMLEVRHQPLLLSRIRFHICTYHEVSQPLLGFLESYIAELRQLVISKLLQFQFTEKMIHFISLPWLQIVGITARLILFGILILGLPVLALPDRLRLLGLWVLRLLDLVDDCAHVLVLFGIAVLHVHPFAWGVLIG